MIKFESSGPREVKDESHERWAGLLLGTALGDAIGLPMENLTPDRIKRLFPQPFRPCLLPGRAMVSDDTDHTVFVMQSLLEESRSPEVFAQRLSWRLRFWLAAVPAGVGFATLRAIIKMWCGFSPVRSGVMSAGNGPAMRVAPIGAWFCRDPKARRAFVEAACHLTHRDPRALSGAIMVAEAAAWIMRERPTVAPSDAEFRDFFPPFDTLAEPWPDCLKHLEAATAGNEPVQGLAERLGGKGGVSGFICHTVPVALYSWKRNFGDFSAAVSEVIGCGGDTDTTGAIVGALAGLTGGRKGLPKEWLDGLWDWPHGRPALENLADRAVAEKPSKFPLVNPRFLVRNPFFLLLILAHGFRRMFPPY